MSYISLYRKYRPQTFAEVVGQRHVTDTIKNALAEDRLHHAYLFTGPRGTGKTSTARILAKALNCEDSPGPQPCLTCAMCVAITDGSAVDVIELDMASHGGVDDARDLRERALFSPARARRKVYILDEVHMASNAAFNALLKLVEEPPAHVLFAMATTEPHKVLPTIMSRVQRLDLRRVGKADLVAHVASVAEREGAVVEPTALEAIASAGDGSVRDALSVLEQVLSFAGREVTVDHVSRLLGHTPLERVVAAATSLGQGDLEGLLGLVGDLVDAGHDLRRFTLDLAGHLRDLIVLQVAPDRPDLIDATDDRRDELRRQAADIDRALCVQAIEILGEALAEMRRGPSRLALEIAFARLAGTATPSGPGSGQVSDLTADRPATEASRPADVTTDDAVEAVADGDVVSGADPEADPVPDGDADREPGGDADREPDGDADREPGGDADREPDGGNEIATGGQPDSEAIRARWPQVLEVVKRASPRVQAICAPGRPDEIRSNVLVVTFPEKNAWHAEELGKTENLDVLLDAIAQVVGVRVGIRTQLREGGPELQEDADSTEQVADVVEADAAGDGGDGATAEDAAEMLRTELGAVRVDDGSSRS